jgi:hypothetical protein
MQRRTAAAVLAVASLAALAAPASAAPPPPWPVVTPLTPAPAPTDQVVAPLAAVPLSASLIDVTAVYTSMNQTVYSHAYVENTATGYYAWDCVGMTDWILHEAAPNAWWEMHQALGIRAGYVPTPTQWAGFLQGSLPSSWQSVTAIGQLQPGDYVVFPASPATRFVGHAVIVAGLPMLMNDGSYAVRVYDSTGTPHGPFDSRLTDPRAINQSGLGNGTMRLYVDSTGAMTGAAWAIDYTAPAGVQQPPTMAGIPITVGRALD